MIDLAQMTLDYQQWKIGLLEATGLARDALHVHIGLAVFVLTRLVWRWRFGWGGAWLVALGFALGGEWFDLRAETTIGAIQPEAAHWHDIWNTMLWPTLLALLGRWLEPRRVRPAAADPPLELSSKDAEQPLEQA
jgi:hypothetical protein